MIQYAKMHDPEDCKDGRTFTPCTLSEAVRAYRANECDGVCVAVGFDDETTVSIFRPPFQSEWYPNGELFA